MLVLPGPGLLVIIVGLAILATEYVWAQRLLQVAKEKATQAKDMVLRKKPEESARRDRVVTGGAILIGTSSWTDPTLIKDGNFYPPGTKTAEGRLKFYASKFPLVEVDSTYYFPPSERNSELWIERTPKDFTFNIKAYSLLTNHPTRPDSLYGDIKAELPKELLDKRRVYRDKLPDDAVDEVWERFRLALYPLHSAGKLGAVLFQFPQYFTISRKNKAYIEEAVSTTARLSDRRRVPPQVVARGAQRRGDPVLPRGTEPAARVRRHAAGVRLLDAADRGGHGERHLDGALPRARPEGVGDEERERERALPLRLRAERAAGMGSEDRGSRRRHARDARPDEQLLPGLRRAERARPRRDARPRLPE